MLKLFTVIKTQIYLKSIFATIEFPLKLGLTAGMLDIIELFLFC